MVEARHHVTLTVLVPVNLIGPLVTCCFTVVAFVNVIALFESLIEHVSPSIVLLVIASGRRSPLLSSDELVVISSVVMVPPANILRVDPP